MTKGPQSGLTGLVDEPKSPAGLGDVLGFKSFRHFIIFQNNELLYCF